MKRHLLPIYPFVGYESVGSHVHSPFGNLSYIPYRLGIKHVTDTFAAPPPSELPKAPVVSPTTFSLLVPTSSGTLIGTCRATDNPTSWAITSGNTAGYFVLDNDGVLRVGTTGMIVGFQYNITVTASNDIGTSEPATITINTVSTEVQKVKRTDWWHGIW